MFGSDTKFTQGAIIFLILIPTLAMQLIFFPYTVDDAYISFRYTKNLANGKGFVFNDGERVEGFSNFLWVVIGTLPFLMGIDLVIFSKIFGMFLSIVNICLLYNLSLKLTNRPWIPALLLSMTPSYALWAVTGMETQLFIFFLILSVKFLFEDREILTAVSFLLLSLIRHEGALIAVATLVYCFISRKRYYKFSSVFIFFYSIYSFWRWGYFGYLFPNTFYRKIVPGIIQNSSQSVTVITESGGSELITRIIGALGPLFDFIIYISPFIFLGLLSLIKRRQGKKNEIRYLLIISVLIIITSTMVGMWMPGFRLYLPAIPFIYIISEPFIPSLVSKQKNRAFGMLLLFFIFMLPTTIFPYLYNVTIKYTIGMNRAHIPVGLWLNSNAPEDTVLAVGDIGAIGFYSNLYLVDFIGLTDEYVAHNGFSCDYLFSKDPGIIILGSSSEGTFEPLTAKDGVIYNDERLQDYSLEQTLVFSEGYYLWIFSKSLEISI